MIIGQVAVLRSCMSVSFSDSPTVVIYTDRNLSDLKIQKSDQILQKLVRYW